MEEYRQISKLKLLPLSGVLGGLIMFAGDQLFYFQKISGADYNSLAKMAEMPVERLIAGGIMGPLAVIFYIIGAYFLYKIFQKSNKFLAAACFFLLAVFLLFAGAYHAVFATYGFAAKLPDTFSPEQVRFIDQYLSAIHTIDYVIGLIWTALFLFLLFTKKSSLKKWMVFFTPTLIILTQPLFKNLIPYPLGTIIYGGWFNLSFVLFFLMSFLAVKE